MNYQSDRAWSDLWLPLIKRTLGPLLLGEAPDAIDMNEATDLIVLTTKDVRIAARVRRPGYFERYPWDMTIRSHRDTGADTEYAKLLAGFGDWYFYAHATNNTGGAFRRWFVVDLDCWRAYVASHRVPNDISNGDGTYFKAYNLRHLRDYDSASIISTDVMEHRQLELLPKGP